MRLGGTDRHSGRRPRRRNDHQARAVTWDSGPQMTNAAVGTRGTAHRLPRFMTAVLLTGHGGFERLELRADVPLPVAGPNEVVIRVRAAGINNTDINTRTGWYSKAVK